MWVPHQGSAERQAGTRKALISLARRSGSSSGTNVRAPVDLHQAGVREGLGQAVREASLKNRSAVAPDQPDGPGEGGQAGRDVEQVGLVDAAMNRAVSPRIAGSVRNGVHPAAGHPGVQIARASGPKPSAECRRRSVGVVSAISLSIARLRPALTSSPNGGGGNLSNASQLVSTSRPMRVGVGVDHELAQRAAGVVADQGDVGEARARPGSRGSAGPRRAGVRSASGPSGDPVRPERQVGRVAADPGGGQAVGDARPQLAVDQQAVDEHDRRRARPSSGTGDPVLDAALGKLDVGMASELLSR